MFVFNKEGRSQKPTEKDYGGYVYSWAQASDGVTNNFEAIPAARARISRTLVEKQFVHEAGNPKSNGTRINCIGLIELMKADYRFS